MVVGQTKDVGFNIGVSRTLPHPAERVWQLLTSPRGIRLWLGDTELGTRRGDRYETADGIVGELRGLRPNDRVRLTWRPADWDHDTTVQVAITPRGNRTVLRFHQERLADSAERETQREHWRAVLDKVTEALG